MITIDFFQQGDIDLIEQNDGADSDCSTSSTGKQVLVGICAMSKKTQSKPMKEILTRLQEFEYIKMVVFAEDVILKVIWIWFSVFIVENLILWFVSGSGRKLADLWLFDIVPFERISVRKGYTICAIT